MLIYDAYMGNIVNIYIVWPRLVFKDRVWNK